MGDLLRRPDTNPWVVALLNLAFFGGLGYLSIGQQDKGLKVMVVTFLLDWMCGLGIVLHVLFAVDGYVLGRRLAAGQPLRPNDNGLPLLDRVFRN